MSLEVAASMVTAFQILGGKRDVFAIAQEQSGGHGECDFDVIREQISYSNAPSFWHPLFKSEAAANEYIQTREPWPRLRVVPLRFIEDGTHIVEDEKDELFCWGCSEGYEDGMIHCDDCDGYHRDCCDGCSNPPEEGSEAADYSHYCDKCGGYYKPPYEKPE